MCNNCIHKAVCSIYRATGGVKKCEHHREERKGRWKERLNFVGRKVWDCSECDTTSLEHGFYCPYCGADMRATEGEDVQA